MPSARADYDVSIVVLRAILAGAAATGADPDAIVRDVGLDPQLLDDQRARVPRETEERVWVSALERSESPAAIGALGALRTPRGTFGALEYAARTAPVAGEAIDVLVEHSSLLHGVPLFTVDRRSRVICVQYHVPHDAAEPYAPMAAELALGTIARVLHEATVEGITPESLELAHAKTDHNLEQLFGARVHHEQNRYALCIARRHADEPMREADPALHDILVDQLAGDAERASQGEHFERRVRRAVENRLLVGAPKLSDVAKALGMAPRTVQAHLGEAGTSFREVIAQARLERAKLYLCATKMSIASVASLAGYSDERSLYRAFRRTLGTTPDAVRRAGRQGSDGAR